MLASTLAICFYTLFKFDFQLFIRAFFQEISPFIDQYSPLTFEKGTVL